MEGGRDYFCRQLSVAVDPPVTDARGPSWEIGWLHLMVLCLVCFNANVKLEPSDNYLKRPKWLGAAIRLFGM